MGKKRVYYKSEIETAARLWMDGVPMASISRSLNMPYRTLIWWIRRMKTEGLERRRGVSSERAHDFRDIVDGLGGDF